MEKQKIKTYVVDGKQMMFNASAFSDYFKKKADKEKKKLMEYQSTLADQVSVSDDTVKAWRYRKNGPVDIETIKKIADFWKIDYKLLLVEVDDMMINTKFDERTRTVVVDCYKELEDFFDDFKWENGRFRELPYIDQIVDTGLYYKELVKQEDCLWGVLDVDGETNEERVCSTKEELHRCLLVYKQEIEKMKRMLRRNVLELPRFVYDKWDEFLTTAYDVIDYLSLRGIPESREYLEDGESDDITNDEEKENLYNVFFEFCKENIEPYMH